MAKKTWWTIKYTDENYSPPRELSGWFAFSDKDIAQREAGGVRFRNAKNVRVVPCDPPVLRHPIKSSNKGKRKGGE